LNKDPKPKRKLITIEKGRFCGLALKEGSEFIR